MANVFDVADYVLTQHGPMSAMKLQKLVFYSQAWSLVWDDAPIFQNRIEAWANGPVIRDLYSAHRGKFQVDPKTFAEFPKEGLSTEQEETIKAVLKSYGDKSSQWLSDQTHAEEPWKLARSSLVDGQRGEQEITLESMAEYYSSI
jgi:uncharacterized phage-associated protein